MEEKYIVNCTSCGESEQAESELMFHEDESINCKCGKSLKFVHSYKAKPNTLSFS
ncbi:hypothetical protein VCHA53O466_320042 [Vibrio chagasii]|nr:hypothetical protein VCHA53O466_320042 [Vibrio chagasii]